MGKKLQLLFCILFLDFLSFSLIITFLPLLFLDTPHRCFLINSSMEMRYFTLGALISIYPAAQFFAAPLLGHFSDKLGRRDIFLFSYLGNGVGYLLCSIGIATRQIEFLFIGYLIAGCVGINLSIVNAMISDISVEKNKTKLFAFPQLLLGMGLMIGTSITERLLSLPHIPFYLFFSGSAISFFNFFLLFYFWGREGEKKFILTSIQWKDLLSLDRRVGFFLFAELLLFFGWYFFIKTFQIFLIEKLHYDESSLFNLYFQYGVSMIVSQLFFISWFHRYSKSTLFFYSCILLLGGSILMLYFFNHALSLRWIISLFTLAYTSLMPLLTRRISDYTSKGNRGKIMGFHQAVQSIAKICAPLLGTLLLTFHPFSTVLLAPLLIFLSYLLFQWRNQEHSPSP